MKQKPKLTIEIIWNPIPPEGDYGILPFDCYHVNVTHTFDHVVKRVHFPMEPDIAFAEILPKIAPHIEKAIKRI